MKPSQELKAGTGGRKQRPSRSPSCWLAPHGLLSLSCYSTRTTYPGKALHIVNCALNSSINHQWRKYNRLAHRSLLWEDFLYWGSLFQNWHKKQPADSHGLTISYWRKEPVYLNILKNRHMFIKSCTHTWFCTSFTYKFSLCHYPRGYLIIFITISNIMIPFRESNSVRLVPIHYSVEWQAKMMAQELWVLEAMLLCYIFTYMYNLFFYIKN